MVRVVCISDGQVVMDSIRCGHFELMAVETEEHKLLSPHPKVSSLPHSTSNRGSEAHQDGLQELLYVRLDKRRP